MCRNRRKSGKRRVIVVFLCRYPESHFKAKCLTNRAIICKTLHMGHQCWGEAIFFSLTKVDVFLVVVRFLTISYQQALENQVFFQPSGFHVALLSFFIPFFRESRKKGPLFSSFFGSFFLYFR